MPLRTARVFLGCWAAMGQIHAKQILESDYTNKTGGFVPLKSLEQTQNNKNCMWNMRGTLCSIKIPRMYKMNCRIQILCPSRSFVSPWILLLGKLVLQLLETLGPYVTLMWIEQGLTSFTCVKEWAMVTQRLRMQLNQRAVSDCPSPRSTTSVRWKQI